MHHRLEFTESENPWAPTAVLAELNDRTGAGLELVGLAEQTGGTSSAAFVRWPDGQECALTRSASPLARMRQTAQVLSLARDRGLPVPRHDLVVELRDGWIAIVQERLPGRHAPRVDARVVDAMVAMNERFAGLLIDHPDVPPPPAFPVIGGVEHPWQATLGQFSDRTRRILRHVAELDRTGPPPASTHDLVHTDYSLGNVLWNDDLQITGIVDWNRGVARGDRWFALLGMRHHLAAEGGWYEGQQEALQRLDDVLITSLGAELLHNYWIRWSAHNVHWSIEHDLPPERIEQDIIQATARTSGANTRLR